MRRDVVVAVPLGVRTGGPEALHQLVWALNYLGYSAAIWPIGRTRTRRAVPEYESYGCSVLTGILPPRGSVLVCPEISFHWLLTQPKGHRWIWWLSVDNSPASVAAKWTREQARDWTQYLPNMGTQRELQPPSDILPRLKTGVLDRTLRGGVRHMAQSRYALDFCTESFLLEPLFVSDFLTEIPAVEHYESEKFIAYNGRKGKDIIPLISHAMPDVSFVPIDAMAYRQVLETLGRASAYLEVGPMPGNDRLPREAARAGTAVISLARGAARNSRDLPLRQPWKINAGHGWLAKTRDALRMALEAPEIAAKSQSDLRQWVLTDKDRFIRQVAHWAHVALDVGESPCHGDT